MRLRDSLQPACADIAGIIASRGGPPEDPDDRRSRKRMHPDEQPAPRLLVVEDDWFVAMEIEESLQKAGFGVIDVVVSAEDAVEKAASQAPDLVIMDIRLAGARDGIDAAIEIRRRFDIPCLFLTAYSSAFFKRRAQLARPVGWLTKPLSAEVLVSAIKAWQKGR